MKKIFEFKVFDIVNNKDNQEFLDKVKRQNPDLYGQFVSIIGNKGLKTAIEKYEYYDPDYWKTINKKIKKEKSTETKEQENERLLALYDTEIKMVNAVLQNSVLKQFEKFIKGNRRIIEYMNSAGANKQYTNLFLKTLKRPKELRYKLYSAIATDRLSWTQESKFSTFDENEHRINRIIDIDQFFNLQDSKLTYSIFFNMPEEWFMPSSDSKKRQEFLGQRNNMISDLRKTHVDKEQIYEALAKFSALLDEGVYQDWYKEWEMRRDAKKYNL
jgi:hypothetical protein